MKNAYLLGVSTVSYRLVVIVFKYNVTKLTIRDIFDYMPFDRKLPTPFILLPVGYTLVKIDRSNHFSHPTELSTGIHLQIKASYIIGAQIL